MYTTKYKILKTEREMVPPIGSHSFYVKFVSNSYRRKIIDVEKIVVRIKQGESLYKLALSITDIFFNT
jgi:hypothetical protein